MGVLSLALSLLRAGARETHDTQRACATNTMKGASAVKGVRAQSP